MNRTRSGLPSTLASTMRLLGMVRPSSVAAGKGNQFTVPTASLTWVGSCTPAAEPNGREELGGSSGSSETRSRENYSAVAIPRAHHLCRDQVDLKNTPVACDVVAFRVSTEPKPG